MVQAPSAEVSECPSLGVCFPLWKLLCPYLHNVRVNGDVRMTQSLDAVCLALSRCGPLYTHQIIRLSRMLPCQHISDSSSTFPSTRSYRAGIVTRKTKAPKEPCTQAEFAALVVMVKRELGKILKTHVEPEERRCKNSVNYGTRVPDLAVLDNDEFNAVDL